MVRLLKAWGTLGQVAKHGSLAKSLGYPWAMTDPELTNPRFKTCLTFSLPLKPDV